MVWTLLIISRQPKPSIISSSSSYGAAILRRSRLWEMILDIVVPNRESPLNNNIAKRWQIAQPIIVLYSGVTKVSNENASPREFSRLIEYSPRHPFFSTMPRQVTPPPNLVRKHWSPHSRTKITVHWNLGWKPRHLKAEFGVPLGTIPGLIARYKVQKSAVSLPRIGRPKKLNNRHERHIIRCIEADLFISLVKLNEITCPYVCTATLRRWLYENGIMH
jgi:transposase